MRRILLVACSLALVSATALAGCGGTPDLKKYTAAGYTLPSGFHYFDMSKVSSAMSGSGSSGAAAAFAAAVKTNPGPLDVSAFPIPSSSGVTAKSAYIAILQSGPEGSTEGDIIISIAVELSRGPTKTELAGITHSDCDQLSDATHGASIGVAIKDKVVAFVFGTHISSGSAGGSGDTATAVQKIMSNIKAGTGATSPC